MWHSTASPRCPSWHPRAHCDAAGCAVSPSGSAAHFAALTPHFAQGKHQGLGGAAENGAQAVPLHLRRAVTARQGERLVLPEMPARAAERLAPRCANIKGQQRLETQAKQTK